MRAIKVPAPKSYLGNAGGNKLRRPFLITGEAGLQAVEAIAVAALRAMLHGRVKLAGQLARWAVHELERAVTTPFRPASEGRLS